MLRRHWIPALRDALARLEATLEQADFEDGSRYDALLRYLRGVHARPTKDRPKPEDPDTDPTER